MPYNEDRIQRRAPRWIRQVKKGELSYKERLIQLVLLPLTNDRQVKDLVFLYQALYRYVNTDPSFLKCVNHGHTRRSQSRGIKYLETATFQSSFFNCSAKLWTLICKLATVHLVISLV